MPLIACSLAQDDRLHWVAVIEDDTYEWDADLVEYVADEKVSRQAIDDRETGEVCFEKLATGKTKGIYQLDYDPAPWQGKADNVPHWMNRRADKDLEAFKVMVEEID
jgi:uncharacterized membrane protein